MSEVEAGKFHAGAAQKGYALNRLCYSLNTFENRTAFKADPGAFCLRFGLSDEEREAALTGDKAKLLAAGANMYFFAKLSRVDRPAKEP
jgi:protocatechuate 4,5-dioxygenase alpha chain